MFFSTTTVANPARPARIFVPTMVYFECDEGHGHYCSFHCDAGEDRAGEAVQHGGQDAGAGTLVDPVARGGLPEPIEEAQTCNAE